MDLHHISITRLAPGAEINKQIFVVVYRSIFTDFTITISCFQVFCIFDIFKLSISFYFCIFRVYLSSILSGFLFFYNSHFFYLYLYIFSGYLYLSYFQVLRYFLYSQIFYIFLTFMLFICFIFRISPTPPIGFSVQKIFYLPVCITEPTKVFLIPVMLKD